jgi:ABC-type transporter MlaC component
MRGFSISLTRRAAIAAAAVFLLFAPAAAGDHPSVTYMKQVGKDLLNAHRQGTVSSFSNAMRRHADVTGIALYSLGQYKGKLANGQRSRYYSGVVTFMARYFADQSREFRVAKYEIGEATIDKDKDVLVNSKVYLLNGKTYNVSWRLGWRDGRYKVLDAKVLGFSLVYLQRGLFTSFIAKRGGNVGELVAVLNR